MLGAAVLGALNAGFGVGVHQGVLWLVRAWRRRAAAPLAAGTG